MFRLLLVATLALIVSACATGPAEYGGTDAGYAVVSIGRGPQSIYEWYSVSLRKADKSNDQKISFHPPDKAGSIIGAMLVTPPDYRDIRMGDGIVVVRRLPPGDYEIYAVSASATAGVSATAQSAQASTYYWEPPTGVNVRFRVAPGQTTYVGSFTIFGTQTTNFIGTPIPSGGELKFSDERSRDIPLAQAKRPELPEVHFETVK